MLRAIKLFLTLTLCAYLLGCGTDSSSGDQANAGDASTPGVSISTSGGSGSTGSSFSMRLTDAPIDGLENVVLQFIAVEMKQQSGAWTKYTLPSPQPIDLLALQGLTTADLLVNMPIEAGDYEQVRFILDGAPMANRVKPKGAAAWKDLVVPSGSTSGLKIKKNFTIPSGRQVNLTVDFDLRRSVKSPGKSGKYQLMPKMKLVIDSNVGFFRGSVDPALLTHPTCSDTDVDTHNAAYVYSGHNVTPGDIDEVSPSNNEPVTTTFIQYDKNLDLYIFEAAFLAPGDYTIALTCNADREVIDENDNGDDGDPNDDDALQFFGVKNVSILITDTTFLKP